MTKVWFSDVAHCPSFSTVSAHTGRRSDFCFGSKAEIQTETLPKSTDLRPLRRHLSVRRAGRWHRDELGAERKAARRKCSKALAPILDIIRKNAVHASLKAVDASRECPA
jgi:hypothetical protein